MNNPFLDGPAYEVFSKALMLRERGYSDEEIIGLAFELALDAYANYFEELGVPGMAMPSLVRDLSAGVRYLKTGSYVCEETEAIIAQEAKQ